uniref:Uncharacterized protein n=1 Tax=Ditylenchus dipsaci TaxID=166011 RepID=A0A915E5H7_9BILA
MNQSNSYYDDNETIVFLHENILNMDCSVLTSIENANSKSRQVLESTTNASPREARKLVPSRIPTPMFRSLTESSAKLMQRSNHRHSSIQSSTSNICENIMPVSYSYPLLVEDVPCGSCEQLAEDLVRSPLRESQLLLSRIHQRPLVKRSYCRRPRALIQPLHHTTSNFTRYQRNSSVSSDFKELNCNNLETVQPVRECDKYKNSFGGFIRPVEKLIAVFRRIQRLQSHSRTRRGKE